MLTHAGEPFIARDQIIAAVDDLTIYSSKVWGDHLRRYRFTFHGLCRWRIYGCLVLKEKKKCVWAEGENDIII